MRKSFTFRVLALLTVLALALVAVACDSDDDDNGSDNGGSTDITEVTDYEALGLWDDGECDDTLEPLKIGLMTVYQSEVLSLEDQALALEASAEAFNARGGANGHCIEVTTCDDGANVDQAVGCVRTLEDAGVVATVNDQGTAGQAEVSAAMQTAGIPRVASNVASDDWGDPNAYPLDASGTGVVFMMPQALVNEGATEIGMIRVDLAAATAIIGLLEQAYEGEATFVSDVPVPAGTTDYSQFILQAESEGASGVTLALGENEAIQIVRAAQQLDTDLLVGSSLGSFSHSSVQELNDFAENMVFLWSFLPPTNELPIYDALREDLANSGLDSLQPQNLKASPMRSWIGLYALLYMIREADLTEFTGENITALLQSSGPVPMHGIFGDEDWDPNVTYEGLFARHGTNYWSSWAWDPEASAPYGMQGNWVDGTEINFSEVLCGSPFGAAEC